MNICCECYGDGAALRDLSDVLTGRVRAWVISGKYTLGEYSLDLGGKPKPEGFNPTWDGSPGAKFVCEKCDYLAQDCYEVVMSAREEFQWELEMDPTGQTQERYGL